LFQFNTVLRNSACLFLLLFSSGVIAQLGVVRPNVITAFGGQVGSSLSQHVMRGEVRLATDVFLSESRTNNGFYELALHSGSRLIARIPHSVGRRSRGVTVSQAVTAIVEQLVNRRLAIRRN